MSWLHVLGGGFAAVLLIYLFAALLNPESFS
jgi:K+-transporting ATPase KdpF subunit